MTYNKLLHSLHPKISTWTPNISETKLTENSILINVTSVIEPNVILLSPLISAGRRLKSFKYILILKLLNS